MAIEHMTRFFQYAAIANMMLSLSCVQNTFGTEPVMDVSASELFETRIMPIFRSPKPSSCIQCHLASVDLKDYILPSHEKTFHALKNANLINIEKPADSKILSLIKMGEKDGNLSAKRLHEKMRLAEYHAFASWIEACCKTPELLQSGQTISNTNNASEDVSAIGSSSPLEIIWHARKSRLVESFARNIWSQRMRCFPCHTPDEINPQNPKHEKASQRHQELVSKHGAKMNLFEASPEKTLDRWIASSRRKHSKHLPLINLESPSDSLILLKPISRVPTKNDAGTLGPASSIPPVSHMGGIKMHRHDQSYKAMILWIKDYAAVVGNRYTQVEHLPTDNWIPTQSVLRMSNLPTDLEVGTPVQLFIYQKGQPRTKPLAFTQGLTTPRGFANGTLSLIRSNISAVELDGDGQRAEHANLKNDIARETTTPVNQSEIKTALPQGKYVIEAYIDRSKKIEHSPTAFLDRTDYVGEIIVETDWKTGFPDATIFSAQKLTRSKDP